MAETKAEKEAKAAEAAEAEVETEAAVNSGADPAALVGSGAKQVKVKAHVGLFGLAAGDEGYIYDTDEVQANLKNGNLELADEK